MSNHRYLGNEHISPVFINHAQEEGFDISDATEVHGEGTNDLEDFIQYCRGNNIVIITNDEDFQDFHSQGYDHDGILFVKNPAKLKSNPSDCVKGLEKFDEIYEHSTKGVYDRLEKYIP